MGENVFTPHFVVQEVKPTHRLLLGLHVERSLELPNLFWSCQAHANLLFSARSSAPRTRAPFLPPSLHGFIGRMSPSDVCRARPPKVPLSGHPDGPTDLPCCKSPRAYLLRPLPRQQDHSHMSGSPQESAQISTWTDSLRIAGARLGMGRQIWPEVSRGSSLLRRHRCP